MYRGINVLPELLRQLGYQHIVLEIIVTVEEKEEDELIGNASCRVPEPCVVVITRGLRKGMNNVLSRNVQTFTSM